MADIVVFAASYNPAVAFGLWLADGFLDSGFDWSKAALLDQSVLILLPLVSACFAYLLFTVHSMPNFVGRLSMEAVGVAFIVLALFSTTGVELGAESFGSAATGSDVAADADGAPSIEARRRVLLQWISGASLSKSQALGLDDGLLYVALSYMA